YRPKEPGIRGRGRTVQLSGRITHRKIARIFNGTIISAGAYNREPGNQAIEKDTADLIAYGRFAISNPDLADRFAQKAELNPYDRSTFYGSTAKGYTDYPTL
ncbi:MAG TPA: hypothetical protein QGI40_06330, partial [Nitrospinaceae bacterium]|nr:hypothetical protein [Nitrospinaceae bacterium]